VFWVYTPSTIVRTLQIQSASIFFRVFLNYHFSATTMHPKQRSLCTLLCVAGSLSCQIINRLVHEGFAVMQFHIIPRTRWHTAITGSNSMYYSPWRANRLTVTSPFCNAKFICCVSSSHQETQLVYATWIQPTILHPISDNYYQYYRPICDQIFLVVPMYYFPPINNFV
jgi:hypothetical protein